MDPQSKMYITQKKAVNIANLGIDILDNQEHLSYFDEQGYKTRKKRVLI